MSAKCKSACFVTCESRLTVGVHDWTARDIVCASRHHGRIARTMVSHHGVSRRWARHHARAIDTGCLDRAAARSDRTCDGTAAKDTVGTRLHHRTAHSIYVVHHTVILHHETQENKLQYKHKFWLLVPPALVIWCMPNSCYGNVRLKS